jgi:branched-chain amino acid transport system substrate-binding protein
MLLTHCFGVLRFSMSAIRVLGLALLVLSITLAPAFPAEEPPQVSDDVVRIGLLLDLSGPYAYLSGEPTFVAAQMAVEDFGGKVLGRPVDVLRADHHNRPELASSLAREWFDAGKVDAIMDVTGGGPAFAVARVAARTRRIVVFNTASPTRLTNEACTSYTAHWTYDGYSLAHVIGGQMLRTGGASWYFVTADWTFGHLLERETADMVRAAGGKVLGSSMHGMDVTDFTSHMRRAKGSGADIVAVVTVGQHFLNAMRAAAAVGIGSDGKQRLATMMGYINDVHILGLPSMQGMYLASAFYWDLDEPSRAWSKRFYQRTGQMPNMGQAGAYSATLHYLKAVQAAGTDRSETVMARMRALPVEFFGSTGRLREDGRVVHDMYLFKVKGPGQSIGPWDYFELVTKVPGDAAFQPLDKSSCPLLQADR